MPFGVEITVADSGTNGNASNWARQGGPSAPSVHAAVSVRA